MNRAAADNTHYGNLAMGDEQPCCDYRDHVAGCCACPEHRRSDLHPFGGGMTPSRLHDGGYVAITDDRFMSDAWKAEQWTPAVGVCCPDCPRHTGGMIDVWCVCRTCNGTGAVDAPPE